MVTLWACVSLCVCVSVCERAQFYYYCRIFFYGSVYVVHWLKMWLFTRDSRDVCEDFFSWSDSRLTVLCVHCKHIPMSLV